MGRKIRITNAGALFHVGNRGIGRRTVFETRRDFRLFLAHVARSVRRKQFRVHAYAVLQTHFHLLVEDRAGALSTTMQRILSRYAQWFNRSRERDGAVFKGRFYSRLVEPGVDFANVVAYIHANPKAAGLEDETGQYPYCSAHDRWRTRPWLTLPALLREGTTPAPSTLYELPVEDWMVERARNADGLIPGKMLESPSAVRARIVEQQLDLAHQASLWRSACGMTLEEIARELGLSPARVHQLLEKRV